MMGANLKYIAEICDDENFNISDTNGVFENLKSLRKKRKKIIVDDFIIPRDILEAILDSSTNANNPFDQILIRPVLDENNVVKIYLIAQHSGGGSGTGGGQGVAHSPTNKSNPQEL